MVAFFRLTKAGIRTAVVELSELAKAEAGVTCCSLVFEEQAAAEPRA